MIGAGMSGLSAAALLSHRGRDVLVLEQNWLPGGCASSYPRHGFTFEAGATTLVGLDEGMPLRWLLSQTGIELPTWRLDVPMQVHLPQGRVVTRHGDLQAWIAEAESAFGVAGQRQFWEECHRLSALVWRNSLRQLRFPPTSMGDYWAMARHASLSQLAMLPAAFQTTEGLLRKHGLADHAAFRAFVDAQLLIAAQNRAPEVNALFGAAALCYTLYGNHYLPGGMLALMRPLQAHVEARGGELRLRQRVTRVERTAEGYLVHLHKAAPVRCRQVLAAIPLNNILPMMEEIVRARHAARLLPPERLWSAFGMGIAFRRRDAPPSLHHQLLLDVPLAQIGADSLFVSLSHPDDRLRCAPDQCVAAISTHIADPHLHSVADKAALEAAVVEVLESRGLLRREDILYQHSSTQKAWEKWTGRAHGFVGGYPQYRDIKPWEMKDARLDGRGAYLCGDSTYPGQGIPGACLSGIIAVEKMSADWGW